MKKIFKYKSHEKFHTYKIDQLFICMSNDYSVNQRDIFLFSTEQSPRISSNIDFLVKYLNCNK